MRAQRLPASSLASLAPGALVGAVLLAPVRTPAGQLRKGLRLDEAAAAKLVELARRGDLPPVRLAHLEGGDLHEDDAAARLAAAVAGAGVCASPPRQSRLDLVARWDGVVHVRANELARLNALDALEVFTLYHGQSVSGGETVACVKVAPHVVEESLVGAAESVARAAAPLVDVRRYLPHDVAAIAAEPLGEAALARFTAGVRRKVEALGSRFAGTVLVDEDDPDAAERKLSATLDEMVVGRGIRVVLVGGVSAGDPLSPFFAALANRGGRLLRRGVPAHPGSMIWLGELAGSRLLGIPQCGMFTMATAADLVLPRLLTGEPLSGADLADLAHGGILSGDMRFRFPPYARDLQAPEG
jgi:hypothetical protein